MFKTKSCVNDVLESMDKNLSTKIDSKTERLNRIANDLISAADIFKKAGMSFEHQEVINIINTFSKKLSK